MHGCLIAPIPRLAGEVRAVVRERVCRGPVGLSILALLCASPAHADVSDYVGKSVSSVSVILDGRETLEPTLLQVVETRIGQPLSMLDVRESVAHLFSLGRFDDVRVDARLEGAEVALRFELTAMHQVTKLEFVGVDAASASDTALRQPGIDEGQLRRVVVERYGSSPPIGRVNELSVAIADTLRERGYRQAKVVPRVDIASGSSRATLVFTVEPGRRTTVGRVSLVGDPMMPTTDFLDRLALAVGVPYEPEALNTRIASYVDERRARGFYEARVTPTVTFEDDGQVVQLTLAVDPGPHVRVTFTGDPLPSDVRNDLVPVEREGSADEDLLEDSSNRIEDYLRAQGYRDAKAPHSRELSEGELLIVFDVHRGPQYRVSAVEIAGGTSLGLPDFRTALRTRTGAVYTDANLDADVTAIESLYRTQGFAGARVQADSRPQAAAGSLQIPMAISILITEGVRTVVGTVRMEGNVSVPEADLRRVVSLQPGSPYHDTQLRRDINALQLEYANLGYRSATVQAQPGFSPDRGQANLVFVIREGPRVFVDHVIISGNVRTSVATIERELQLKPGDPLGLEAAYESQRRLAALQLFRRAPQLTEIQHGDETRRDLLVTVEEAEPTTLGFGGGVEGRLRVVESDIEGAPAEQEFELAPRAFVDVTRRNLFGTNRSVSFFGSLSLHPGRLSSSSSVGYESTEYRVLGTFREPRVFDTAVDGVVSVTFEQQIRSSFTFARQRASAQASRQLTRSVGLSGGYQLERTNLLESQVDPSDQPLIDRLFAQVRLSSFSVQLFYDTRDDPVDASRGEYFTANTQLAARRIGSEVGFVKSFFTAQHFRPLRGAGGSVFAAQARLGVANGFPRDVVGIVNGETVVIVGVEDLPEPERFFAGGNTTVRGFALDTLGRPETIKDGFPIGGNGMAIFNVELRGPVFGGVQGVGFVDTGNVFGHASDIDLGLLRTAVGFGVRYKSPVGPIRFDVGFKVNPEPGERPSAWFITFGQAF
jgi:outer membrane protein assembly complex protein YaeT